LWLKQACASLPGPPQYKQSLLPSHDCGHFGEQVSGRPSSFTSMQMSDERQCWVLVAAAFAAVGIARHAARFLDQTGVAPVGTAHAVRVVAAVVEQADALQVAAAAAAATGTAGAARRFVVAACREQNRRREEQHRTGDADGS
jgi:hypothetical protein